MKKTIILGLPRSFDVYKRIIQNLEFYDYEVIDISFDEHGFKIKKNTNKIIHAVRKIFLKDYDYKSQLKFKPYQKNIINKLNNIIGQAEYALIIRSDIYPLSVIKLIKQKSKKIVGYQWDGLNRFPGIYRHIPLYDKFFVFDEKDKNYPNVILTHNFYFDYDDNLTRPIKQDFFFIGTYVKNRMPKIEALLSVLDEIKMTYKVVLVSNKPISTNNHKIIIQEQFIPYEEYLEDMKSSNICLDFLNEKHAGLSFRTFEAMFYNKKLITNNTTIKNYDFYNPNNIFIWSDNPNDLKKFLFLPYINFDFSIKEKYGFKNWLDNLIK